MSKEYKSLEHIIREIAEGVGIIGDDKPKGTPKTFLTRKYKSQNGGHTSAGHGSHANMKQADDIKMECAPPETSGVTMGLMSTESGKKKIKEGDQSTDGAMSSGDSGSLSATESGKKKMKEEVEQVNEVNVNSRHYEIGFSHGINGNSFQSPLPAPTLNGTRYLNPKEKSKWEKTTRDYAAGFKSGRSSREKTNEEAEYTDVDGVSKGTEERRKVVNVGRPDTAKNPMDTKAKLAKQTEIKTKIIDEEKTSDNKEKVALEKGKTKVEFNPTLKNANPENVGEEINKNESEKGIKEMSDEVKNPLIDAFLALQAENSGNMFEAAKHLSAKQKKIAAVAGDKDKIDAADFAALRAGKKMDNKECESGCKEEVEQVDEISTDTARSFVSKAKGTGRTQGVLRARGKMTGEPYPLVDKKHGNVTVGHASPKVLTKEDVEFSADELAHFDSVVEALGQSKDATQKGSFNKAGSTTTNGDPVRPTVPDRDLTDSVIEETEKKEYKKLSYDEFVKGRIENPTPEQHKEIGQRLKKAGVPGSGWHFRKAKEMQKNVKEETIDEARGRPKKTDDDAPQHSGRDPKQHIQVIAGQAAAGRHIEFHHNDGSKSTITHQKGREIVAKLNGMKPAERHAAVNKMHDSSKGM